MENSIAFLSIILKSRSASLFCRLLSVDSILAKMIVSKTLDKLI